MGAIRAKGGQAAKGRGSRKLQFCRCLVRQDLKCQTAFKSGCPNRAAEAEKEREAERREVIFMLTVLWQCLWHVAVALVVVAVIACGMSCLSLKIVFIMPSALSIAALRSL